MAKKDERKLKLLHERMQAGLTEDEREFLIAAELGDIEIIKKLIESETVSVNCVDAQGRTALESAVAANDEDIVHYLLERVKDKTVHKALLAACDNDRDNISEIILQHRLYQERVSISTHEQIWERVGGKKKGAEPDVDTLLREALLRAAKRNNFQIVKQLMLMGAYVDPPHDYFCNCNECNTQRTEDFKVYTNNRLDTYSAMASPAYISLTEEDPIMSAFKLSMHFRRSAEIEGEFKVIYNELAAQVENFTLALLDQCHSSDEVKAVLSGKPEMPEEDGEGDDEEDDNDILPMLNTAIRMEQKRFVAHPQCQAQIAELWYSGVPFLRYLNRFTYLMLAIPIGIVLVPIMSIIYLIAPCSKVTTILDTPLMRFLSYTCSYLSFLIFVMVTKLRLTEAFDSFACDEQDPYVFAVITVLLLWIFGLIWEECKQIWQAGAIDYFRSFWNVVDSLMLSLLLASFVLEIVTPLRLRQVLQNDGSGNVSGVTPICNLIKNGEQTMDEFCNTGRKDNMAVVWESDWVPDPELLSDILFTFGTILSIGRFSFIMPANEALGTMLVSFHRTINDLLKLCGMFILVLIAFASGLSALYAPSKCRNEHFGSFGSTISMLTWSMFGMGDMSAPASHGTGPLASLTNNPYRDAGVTTIGYYLYGIYVFAAMVVLLNLLIAVMSNTFEEVQGVSDVEWKFARTELWLTFIEPGSPVPPPFNIIPSPKGIFDLISSCCKKSTCCKKKPEVKPKIFKYASVQTSDFELSNADRQSDTKSESSVSSSEKHNRQDLYCILIRRYTREVERQRSEGDDDASEDILRKLIERVTSKIEKKIEELFSRIGNVESNVTNVQEGESDIVRLQHDHTELIMAEGRKRETEGERFIHMIDQAKLELLSRMEAERVEIVRIWEEQLREVLRRLEEGRGRVADRVAELEAMYAAGEAAKRAESLHRPKRAGPDE